MGNLEVKIDNKLIGENHPCFIIAEAGVNHDGDIKKAKKLIDIAKDANVDAVKFQTWITEEIVTKSVNQAEYQKKNTGILESQFDMLKRLELSFDEFRELKDYADKKRIVFLSTPDDEISVDFLDDIGLFAYKIGSGELTNIFMLKRIAKKKKPIILSTGMADLNEIREAVNSIHEENNKDLVLLHCTSQYPTEFKDVNLRAMITLKNTFNTLVGYSDHTLGFLVPQLAVCLGACIIEKHFTYDKNANGPDHICSLDSTELKKMVKRIRNIELILGSRVKDPISEEIKLRKLVRKSIVAKIDILKNTIITKDMLALKRAGGFLEPKDIYNIINKRTTKEIKRDNPISKEDLI